MIENKHTGLFAEQIVNEKPFEWLQDMDQTNSGMLYILFQLDKSKKALSAGELAKKLKVSTARIAVLLKKLEKYNWVKRITSTKDARITLVNLTEKGKKYYREQKDKLSNKLAKIIEKVGVQKFEKFMQIANEINKVTK